MTDGIPLYFGQAGGTIENTTHGQAVSDPTSTNFGAGLYEYLDYRPSDVKDGTNPLNECNAYDLNGDGAVSGYVYYTTKDAPYAIGCFMGETLDSSSPVAVTRTSFDDDRQGWTGQTVGEAIDVSIVSNYFGTFSGKTYSITEMFVNKTTSFLDEGEYAQVLWRVLDASDDDFSSSATCFELRYRANKDVTTNDETEIICSRVNVPDETLDFMPFELNDASATAKSDGSDDALQLFKLDVLADN